MSIFLISLGILLTLAGIIGCMVPIIPGPPLSFCALLLLSIAYRWEVFSPQFLIATGTVTAVVTAFDYILPLIAARKFGASKLGILGSILGMIIGIIFFPPFGLLIGALLGAIFGEYIYNLNARESLRAGLGVFLGTIISIFIKLGTCGVFAFYFFRALFRQ